MSPGLAPPSSGWVTTLKHMRRSGETRWASLDGRRIYAWDSLHGEFEVYNKRGKHLGVVDRNGVAIKPAVKGRSIDV